MATDALGIDNTESALETAILSGSPDILLKMKEVESNLKIEIKRLDIKQEELHGKDRGSARLLAAKNMLPQVILSVLYTIGYFSVMWQFVTGAILIPTESTTAFNIMLGALTASQHQIMNFCLGSSSGSKHKDFK